MTTPVPDASRRRSRTTQASIERMLRAGMSSGLQPLKISTHPDGRVEVCWSAGPENVDAAHDWEDV